MNLHLSLAWTMIALSSMHGWATDRPLLSEAAMVKLSTLLERKRPTPAAGEMDRYLGPDTEEIRGAMREVIENGVTSIGGHVVNWRNAIGILVPLGDDHALQYIAERLKERDSAVDVDLEKCALRSGQLKLIPTVAPYLETQEPADRLPTPPNVDFGGPGDRVSMVACRIIRAALQGSAQVEKSVSDWATSVEVPEGGDGREPLREAYRDWWHENEAAFRAGNYGAVRPGKVPVYGELGVSKETDESKGHRVDPASAVETQQSGGKSVGVQMKSVISWSVGIGSLIVCVVGFWYMKRRAYRVS